VETASAQHWHDSLPPLAIGDSTMLLALPGLARDGFDVNAHGCRQYPEALALLAELARAGRLPHLVVIALGANGAIEPGEIAQALRTLGPGRVLVLLTPRELGGGSGSDAQLVRAESRRHGENLVALDWVTYSAAHPQWFEPDGLHVNPTGAAAMSRLIATVLPLAKVPPAVPEPHCHQESSPLAVVPRGEQGAVPTSSEEPLHSIRLDTHGDVLRVDRGSRRLGIPLLNSNADGFEGLARIESDTPRRTLLAAACFSLPPGGALLEVPVTRALVVDAELLTRFKVRLALDLFSDEAASARIDANYVLRTGSVRARPAGSEESRPRASGATLGSLR
jgi:hypothetical protein